MSRFLVFVFVFATPVFCQSLESSFVIDKSQPFAYIVFDHIAKQKPQYAGDDPKRLFLRVVNNCKIPIRFTVNNANPGPGYIVDHDVIPEPEPSEELSAVSLRDFMDEQSLRKSALKQMPQGYSIHLGENQSVLPGQSLLINMPRNHVSQYWIVRVGFEFVLESIPTNTKGTGPEMYLTFTEGQIPFSKR
jgi:hypothetical protein